MSYLQWQERKRTPGYQGLDYLRLELLPSPNSPTSARASLSLFEVFGSPFTADDFQIEDGRGRPLPFSVFSQSSPFKEVVLEIMPPWDAGQYRLRLSKAPGANVDPFFAELVFTFHIACERGDCRPLPEVAARRAATLPVVDTATKDFNGFVRLLSEWVKVRNPHFADLSPASFERVLLELLAHHGDMTSYYQDRVAAEGFFEQASQRHSVRQHALLIGAELFDGTSAETWLAFDWSNDGFLPPFTEVSSARESAEAGVTFHTVEGARALSAHSRLTPAAWPGAFSAAIPAGASEVLLFGQVGRLAVGQKLAFVDGALGQPGSFSQVVTITRVQSATEVGWVASPADAPSANAQPVTRLTFQPALSRAVQPWAAADGFILYGNLARARHGQRILGYRPSKEELRDPHNAVTELMHGAPLLRALRLPTGPVARERLVDAAGRIGSAPLVKVRVDGEPWERVEHLHASVAYDRHFVARADEDGSLWVEFGDGAEGRALPVQDGDLGLVIDYWVASSSLGNVGAGILTHFSPERSSAERVVNVVPATGGRDAETLEAARHRVPFSLRHGPLERAVTLSDYAHVARSVAGVARAVARDIGGPFNAVLVLVDPESQVELSDELRRDVEGRVEALRMAGREIFVQGPRYVPIDVELALCVEPGFVAHRVRQAVLRALLPGARGDGYFHPDRLSFGQALELTDVLALVQRVPGVRSVKALKFRELLSAAGPAVSARLAVGVTEVLRMDGDATRPEHGKLEVRVVDLDDSVDKSAFLIAE